MTHTIRIDSKSALVGVVAALVCVVAMGQVSISRATTPTSAIAPAKGIGNPHPRDMVQLRWTDDPNDPPVTLSPGGSLTVFDVPSDKWLVLLPSVGPGSPSGGVPIGIGGPGGNADLFEFFNGVYNFKARADSSAGGALGRGPITDTVGWTFRPGSSVVIRNLDTTYPATVSYNFFGYLTDL